MIIEHFRQEKSSFKSFSGVVLVVFGILVLVHGASLGGSGAGLWAGAGALVAGALGVVATLATSSTKTNSAFSSAHLASSLIALALSNMAAITALTAVVRDSQRTPEVSLLSLSVCHAINTFSILNSVQFFSSERIDVELYLFMRKHKYKTGYNIVLTEPLIFN